MPDATTILTTVLALVVVFLFAIQKFSRQIQLVAGDRLKKILNDFTSTPIKGVMSGALVTGLLQSSIATSVILVGLVNSGIISSFNAIGVVVGANIGTTITAQLVALNMTYIAPIIVIFGFIVSHVHSRFMKYGKAIFYFGIIFFSLFIISNTIEPLKDNTLIGSILDSINNPFSAIAIGAIITIMFQSSAVFTGLIIILAGSGLITLPVAIGFMFGSNIGSPITALVASTGANFEAKKVAIAHMLFNIMGVIVFLPFVYPFMKLLRFISENEVQQIVNAHFLFNVINAIICLTLFKQFERLVQKTSSLMYKN